jgi:hypothetical protein
MKSSSSCTRKGGASGKTRRGDQNGSDARSFRAVSSARPETASARRVAAAASPRGRSLRRPTEAPVGLARHPEQPRPPLRRQRDGVMAVCVTWAAVAAGRRSSALGLGPSRARATRALPVRALTVRTGQRGVVLGFGDPLVGAPFAPPPHLRNGDFRHAGFFHSGHAAHNNP